MKRAMSLVSIPLLMMCALFGHVSTSWADDDLITQTPEHIVDKAITINLNLNVNVGTTVAFSSAIEDVSRPPWKELDFKRRSHHITLRPQTLPEGRDIFGNVTVETEDSIVTLVLHATLETANAHSTVVVTYRDHIGTQAQKKAWEIAVREAAEARCAKTQAEARQLRLELASYTGKRPNLPVLDGNVVFDRERIPIPQQRSDEDPYSVDLQPLFWERIKSDWYLFFELRNGTPLHYRAGHVRLYDEYDIADYVRAVYIETGRINPSDDVIATISRGTSLKMAVLLRDLDSIGDYLNLSVTQPDESRPVRRERIPVWDLTPPPDENAGRVTVSVVANAGAAWIADGAGQGRLDAAFLRALGARVTYGFTKYINVESQIVVADTGDARFSDITIDAMQGELTRRAVLGRLQFGGLLRWGDRYMPTLRIGLGAQGTSYDSQFSAGDAPETSFEFSFFLAMSAGIDVRLGHDFVAGLEISGQSPLNKEVTDLFGRAVQGGLYVGYAWKR